MSGRKLRITIEGEMGTGKTTFAKVLHNHLAEAGARVHLTDDAEGSHVNPDVRFTRELLAGFHESIEIVTKRRKCVACGHDIPLDTDFCEDCTAVMAESKDGG